MKNRIKLLNNVQNNYLKWTNLPEIVDMYMIYEISFINVYGGIYENKWKFNIHYENIDGQIKKSKPRFDAVAICLPNYDRKFGKTSKTVNLALIELKAGLNAISEREEDAINEEHNSY